MVNAWRISKTRYAAASFDGKGARRNGGRWNTVGTRVAYASGSGALAILEVLAGLQDTTALSSYSMTGVKFDEDLVEVLDRGRLPATWNHHPPSPETQRVGDLWVAEGRSAVLKVPSAIVPAEHNYVLNPGHPQFGTVLVHSPQPFQLDPRLLR